MERRWSLALLAHSACLGAHQPKHLPKTHTHTHTHTTLPSHYKTHAPGKAVNEANMLNECTGKQVSKREAPTSRLGDLPLPTGNTCSLSCFRSDLLLSEVSPSSSCGKKPKKKKNVPLSESSLSKHWSKSLGEFDLVCYLLVWVCCLGGVLFFWGKQENVCLVGLEV